MTRKEEIIKVAQGMFPSGTQYEVAKRQGFIRGAKYADKTLIEKACKWLDENCYKVRKGTWQEIKEQFINDFRKAMEE